MRTQPNVAGIPRADNRELRHAILNSRQGARIRGKAIHAFQQTPTIQSIGKNREDFVGGESRFTTQFSEFN